MNERRVELLIIGGGPAGLAAAEGAYGAGCRDILVVDREDAPGGILKQCIHNGFGLHTFNEELTGPEYADRFIRAVEERRIALECGTMAIELTPELTATVVSRDKGLERISAAAVVLATGCRERPRGALATPGTRPSGIFTAGTAQKLVNLKGIMPGKRIVILGSGDIGLIMARRMTLEGAKVLACVELMPYSSGLRRNIAQCLDDFGIPLCLSHTVTDIEGKERLESVTIARVDDRMQPVPGSERKLECDTLLLSVGLLPENELAGMANVAISPSTGGAEVDETLETGVPGIFSAGNALHVHDLVDFVSEEAERAGASAAIYASGRGKARGTRRVLAGNGVRALTPQFLSDAPKGNVKLMFRPAAVYKNARVVVESGGVGLFSRKERILAPGEMVSLTLPGDTLSGSGDVSVRLEV